MKPFLGILKINIAMLNFNIIFSNFSIQDAYTLLEPRAAAAVGQSGLMSLYDAMVSISCFESYFYYLLFTSKYFLFNVFFNFHFSLHFIVNIKFAQYGVKIAQVSLQQTTYFQFKSNFLESKLYFIHKTLPRIKYYYE